jgi:transcriptional regulator with XRE-family HTH domain
MATTAGAKIKRRREKQKLTQSQVGRILEVESIAVSRWERDMHEPTVQHAAQLAELLGGKPGDYRRRE